MLKILILLLVISFCIFINNPLLVAQEEYFPLEISNLWRFDYHDEDRNHNCIDSTFTISIIDTSDGYYLFDKYFLYLSSLLGGDSSLFKLEDKKVIRRVKGRSLMWYNFAADVGDKWIIPIREAFFGDTTDILVELKSKTEKFVLGQDSVNNCYLFQFQFIKTVPDIFPWYELFAPNIGLAQTEMGDTAWYWRISTLKGSIINGSAVTVSYEEYDIPYNFYLVQNYPNPFNSETKIIYHLPHTTKILLQIYDLLGKRVKTLVEEIKNSGSYTVFWRGLDDFGSELSSGIYILHLQAGSYSRIKKMILIK